MHVTAGKLSKSFKSDREFQLWMIFMSKSKDIYITPTNIHTQFYIFISALQNKKPQKKKKEIKRKKI